MSGDMYDWEHCDHKGIGRIGCPVCDCDKGRVIIRAQRLDNRELRAQRDALAEALEGVMAELRVDATMDGVYRNPCIRDRKAMCERMTAARAALAKVTK